MAKLREDIEQNLPFISVLNYGGEEYIGIIINQDQFVTSFYDLNAIKTPEEKAVFLEIGETWWWESNRQFPISIFCREQITPFAYAIKTFNTSIFTTYSNYFNYSYFARIIPLNITTRYERRPKKTA